LNGELGIFTRRCGRKQFAKLNGIDGNVAVDFLNDVAFLQLGGGGFAIVEGGILNTTNNGIIQVTPGGAGVGLTSVTNDGTGQIPGGEIIVVTGTGLTNNGTILVDTNADNSTTRIRFDADGTLGGSGSVTLNGSRLSSTPRPRR